MLKQVSFSQASKICHHIFLLRRVPVECPASFYGHPVNSKVHLPDERRHADGHCVGCTQHHAGLLPHDPAGGDTQHRLETYWIRTFYTFHQGMFYCNTAIGSSRIREDSEEESYS